MTGDPNASMPAAEPLQMGPQFGGHGAAAGELSARYVNQASLSAESDRWPTRRLRVAVSNTRNVDLTSMVRHGRTGEVVVRPDSASVTLDGELLNSEPVERVALSRL